MMVPTKITTTPTTTPSRRPSKSARYEAIPRSSGLVCKIVFLYPSLTEKQSADGTNVLNCCHEAQIRTRRTTKVCELVSHAAWCVPGRRVLTVPPRRHCLQPIQERTVISVDCRSCEKTALSTSNILVDGNLSPYQGTELASLYRASTK
jgi:hypothetical protein